MPLNITRHDLQGVLTVTPVRHADARGFFSETWNAAQFAAHGIRTDFVQDNQSLSRDAGVLRGLHYQAPPAAQAKLVRVLRGAVLDVVVDIRRGSPTFGQHVKVELSAANWAQIYVPEGFAHGLLSLEPDTEVLYKVSAHYAPAQDAGIAWDDPALGIDWGWPAERLILSEKDRHHPRLADITSPFVFDPEPVG
ncbi:dTDP-4-dehydrorhamnose 3,5-epimerase [Paroceanicella profunda]|uniref:dTDP-4-dehydrorhamnose 3,5-epimerase n=1 Tax=Paroceanicella profunda TaxID=2579971 RepID=A0A5B8FGN9_9RHOB|nr:dTDP-4-dehydrorhamnose 3,5-epimerase [Paroceanicella profunda]QDL91217.1 dTDP-4-dehydrorhamnose 3,5-epimerase [Paroceanicella profunda]